MEILRLDHAALLVKDVERSRRFYSQVLGMEEVPRPHSFTFPGAWLRKGGAEIHLIGEAEPGRAAQVQPGGYRPMNWPLATLRISPSKSPAWRRHSDACKLTMLK